MQRSHCEYVLTTVARAIGVVGGGRNGCAAALLWFWLSAWPRATIVAYASKHAFCEKPWRMVHGQHTAGDVPKPDLMVAVRCIGAGLAARCDALVCVFVRPKGVFASTHDTNKSDT
jgi:hypothetical protein